MTTIAFTGGGTGGHIYPGLALTSYLKQQFPSRIGRIFWIGSSTGMDRAVIEAAGLEFYGVPTGKLRRYFSFKNFLDLFKIAAGFFAARSILKREKPALLFSKGGFVSVPPCAAAASLGIPVFTHESDYSPGLATRINARFAEKIFVPYRETAAFFKKNLRNKIIVAGNPIRPEFQNADPAKGRAFLGVGEERLLLVLGGSLGAREVNELIRETLPELTKIYTVVHQTGAGQDGSYRSGERYRVFPYIKEELPHIIAAAEVVICRCGANTLWECASLGRPLALIPLRGAGTRGDQVENARIFEEAGCAVNLVGSGISGGISAECLVKAVYALAGDDAKRAAMSAAAAGIVSVGGTARIAEEIVRSAYESR
ncbi:MAG: undecaprenyldiphospho-muramoylpentapeptide beta-N-acetylglucosaminyltransferase [Treponema sp.]|jgi:UDP-N-acetylglucosamine--N-acetylmuramyl-(pentapeptide) pyrophosphoryl-undecaprenol N-acetylglucosamine transferase|nr:undecaprenyldiphospho-muramoylpentapeptide beta-N-acetylglucosaminyltransferase [Treponema sp.]